MKKSVDQRIEERAAEWVAREDRLPLPPELVAQREAWLQADARHLGAYARAHAVYARTGRLSALTRANPLPQSPPASVAARLRHLHLWLGALAAVLCLLVWGGAHLGSVARQDYATRKGEIRRVPLADGSAMTLDSDSSVQVRYAADSRSVVLLRGEVLFDVAKDPARPFVVRANDTAVTAVGTSFSVSLASPHHGDVEVLVREGTVKVAGSDGVAASMQLTANHRALAERSRGIRIESVPLQDMQRQLAWREGMLSFNGDTLFAAAAQFLRYSDVRIVIDDPQVGRRRIVGLYSANDPVGFARSVAVSLGLVMEQQNGIVRLRAQDDAPHPQRAVDPPHRTGLARGLQ